jgi:hypothetical protein
VTHVIHNIIKFYEMEAQSTCAMLGQVQKSLTASGNGRGSAEDQEEPTWAQRVDRQVEETETRLQRRLREYDRILEGLVGASRISASA